MLINLARLWEPNVISPDFLHAMAPAFSKLVGTALTALSAALIWMLYHSRSSLKRAIGKHNNQRIEKDIASVVERDIGGITALQSGQLEAILTAPQRAAPENRLPKAFPLPEQSSTDETPEADANNRAMSLLHS